MDTTKKVRPTVLAKLTATRNNGDKIIIEVHKTSTFHTFYHWYKQVGKTRKVFLRTSNRNDGIRNGLHYQANRLVKGLHLHLIRFKGDPEFVDVQLKVFKKKIYRKKCLSAPDDPILGEFYKTAPVEFDGLPVWAHTGARAGRIPLSFDRTPLAKREARLFKK